jgi:hypothetical protein
MRIRQIKPDFWSDEELSVLPYSVRLFYIGLWCLADDAGYLEWRPAKVGQALFGYETRHSRERHVEEWATVLVESGHLQMLPCHQCALVPTLARHQRIGGTKSYAYRDRHRTHVADESIDVRTSPDKSVSNGRVGNGRERNVTVDGPVDETEFQRKVPRPVLVPGREAMTAAGLDPKVVA